MDDSYIDKSDKVYQMKLYDLIVLFF